MEDTLTKDELQRLLKDSEENKEKWSKKKYKKWLKEKVTQLFFKDEDNDGIIK